jgi:hypothetical protein
MLPLQRSFGMGVMGKCICAFVGGLILLLAGGGAMADELKACRKALATREYDVAIAACTKAEESASTPADAAMAGALRSVASARKDMEGRAGSVLIDGGMVRDPDADPRRRGDEEIVIEPGD